MLAASLLPLAVLGVAAPAMAADARPAALSPAWMVIVDGASRREDAEARLGVYKDAELPEHDDGFPRVMLSTDVVGLRPGIWIVVAAVSRTKEPAVELARFIKRTRPGVYVKPVEVPEPEDLHVFVLRRAAGRGRGCREDPVAPVLWRLRIEGKGRDQGRWSRSRADENGGAVIPFVLREGEQAFAETDFSFACNGTCPGPSILVPPSASAVHVMEAWRGRILCAE